MQEPLWSGRIRIDFAQASDPGRDPNKQVNEDSCGYAETRFGHLCVLCDGMGGHYGGKEASRTAITTIFEMFDQLPTTMPPATALKEAIEEAARRVYRLGGPPENRTRPGSTVVALLIHDRGLDVAHVGDSRAYVMRSNQIYPLTRDHSMVQGMIDAGMLTEETAMGHPDSNKITRALGMKPEVEVELRPETMELFAGDLLVQSSDGLTDLALGREILGATRQALASGTVEHACNMLVQMANERGGHDNITVQMVRVVEVGAKANTTIPDRQPEIAATAPPGPVSVPGAPSSYAGHAGAAPGPTPPMTPTPGMAAPLETIQMTSPGLAGPGPSFHAANPGGHTGPQAGGMAWAPPNPTTPDPAFPPPSIGPAPAPTFGAPPPQGSGPTLTEGTPPPAPAWGLQPPPAGAAPAPTGLAPYRVDGPAGLPLPPPSIRPLGGGSGPYAGPAQSAAPVGFGPPPPTPGAIQVSIGGAPANASKGGLVFLIIGMSGVIAVLILVIVWALWLR
jgi:PPM family protein phosphatase